MRRSSLIGLFLVATVILAACKAPAGPTTTPADSTPGAVASSTPARPPAPTATPAPAFLPIGQVAELQDQAHGITGRAEVVGARQILLQGFSYDGQGQTPDIRLARAGQLDKPLAVLVKLDRGVKNTALLLTVPPDLAPGATEVIAVYSQAEGKAYASGKFTQPVTPPTATPGGALESPLPTP